MPDSHPASRRSGQVEGTQDVSVKVMAVIAARAIGAAHSQAMGGAGA